MNLKTFRQVREHPSTEIEVLAIEPVIYLLRISTAAGGATQSSILKNPKGENWVFRSLSAARAKLAEWKVTEAVLVQQSAYSEMVGTPGDQQDSELRMPIRIAAELP